MKPSITIVSNRLPVSIKKTDKGLEFFPSVGGLATGLAAYVNDKNNKWIGWPGMPSDDLTAADREEIARELKKKNCYPVFLTKKQIDDFYNGYSNSILWPAFHDLPVSADALKHHDRWWKAYREVNAAFAGVVLALSNQTSTVWIHDYQLLTLPTLLRAVRPKAQIGFFLHIPFPSLIHMSAIPSARPLLEGMTGSDLIGMHTRAYTDNFFKAAAELTDDVVEPGSVIHGTHVSTVTDFPMGIDYDRFSKARDLAGVKRELRKHQAKYKGLKVILTVDRLDPTKGIAERLVAYQAFLKQNPQMHRKVIMVMLAVPSRTEIDEYKKLRERVEKLIKDIRTEFATAKWDPIDYLYTSMPVESVTALYQVADVAFITPIRDGMNLVAKEYIASRPKRDGVLILSSTAGAAQELQEALLVNPKRPETLIEALNKAVRMPKHVMRRRIGTMHRHIARHTVQQWAKDFMGSLQKPVKLGKTRTLSLTAARQNDIVSAFQTAAHPLLLLDYDGVLAPLVSDPTKSAPSKVVLQTLNTLCKKADVAVISGRSTADLERWLGHLPLTLAAEHGALLRIAGHKRWQRLTATNVDWQNDLLPVLKKYTKETPGAQLEQKQFSLVWHYRNASPYYAQKNLVILKKLLRLPATQLGLLLQTGIKILEIKPADISKGLAAHNLLQRKPYDFVLSIGDDVTDEDMFNALPETAYSIKVGRARTVAGLRATNSSIARELLKSLT